MRKNLVLFTVGGAAYVGPELAMKLWSASWWYNRRMTPNGFGDLEIDQVSRNKKQSTEPLWQGICGLLVFCG